jgi:hypothetical protein
VRRVRVPRRTPRIEIPWNYTAVASASDCLQRVREFESSREVEVERGKVEASSRERRERVREFECESRESESEMSIDTVRKPNVEPTSAGKTGDQSPLLDDAAAFLLPLGPFGLPPREATFSTILLLVCLLVALVCFHLLVGGAVRREHAGRRVGWAQDPTETSLAQKEEFAHERTCGVGDAVTWGVVRCVWVACEQERVRSLGGWGVCS